MANFYQGLTVFVEPLGLVIAVVFLYGIVGRSQGPAWIRQLVLGTSLGLAAVYSMFNPIPLTDGVIIDMRNMFVSLSAAFFGPIAGILTVAITAATRVSIGGVGLQAGLLGIGLSFGAGLLWRSYISPLQWPHYGKTFVLGVMASAHLFAAYSLPANIIAPFLIHIAPFLFVGNIGGTFILSALIRRERGLIEETENLSEAAATDPLTNLLNRRSAETAVANLPQKRTPGNGRAILYFDIDHFKVINDSHGHAAGDMILKGITARVQECLRPQDLFSRLGGDEFAIILPDVNQIDAHTIAERCREAVEQMKFQFKGAHDSATISIGVRWSENPSDFTAQLAKADSALYAAKVAGRNQVAFETSADIMIAKTDGDPT